MGKKKGGVMEQKLIDLSKETVEKNQPISEIKNKLRGTQGIIDSSEIY